MDFSVIPVETGIQFLCDYFWIPALVYDYSGAGMTDLSNITLIFSNR